MEYNLYALRIYFTPNLILEKSYEKKTDLKYEDYSYYIGKCGHIMLLTDSVIEASYSSNPTYMYNLRKAVNSFFNIPLDNIHVVNMEDEEETFDMPF